MEEVVVSGVAFDRNQAKVTVTDLPDRPGVASKIFGALAEEGINVDMIIQSSAEEGRNDISFTISRTDAKKALPLLEQVKESLRARRVVCDTGVVKVSIVGVGMRSHPGVAATMFRTLADGGINIDMISTSEIKLACVVKEADGEKAVRLLHRAFGLDKPKPRTAAKGRAPARA